MIKALGQCHKCKGVIEYLKHCGVVCCHCTYKTVEELVQCAIPHWDIAAIAVLRKDE